MKKPSIAPALIGGILGFTDGLAFVLLAQIGFGFVPVPLLYASLPGAMVIQTLESHFNSSQMWIPMAAGILAMTVLGAMLGTVVGLLGRWIKDLSRRLR